MNRIKKLRVALLLGFLSVASTTLFATQKKTEKVALDVEQKKREKSTKQGATLKSSRGEAFITETEGRLLSEIEKAINVLSKNAARLPKKSTSRLDMREKLLNLRLEAAVYNANGEMRIYDKKWEAWDRGGRKGQEPKLDDSKSRNNWKVLAQDAQTLLDEYPRAQNADNTMFNMGLAYNFLKQDKEAARIFSQLIAKYPNSQKAGDAYFSLGDFYFDKTDFRNAMNNYKNALRFKQAKSFSWSLFKLAWCNYNLQQYPTSLAYWKQTVSEANRGGKKGAALKEEALRDMVYGFAELRQVEPAIAYYKANGGQKYIAKFLILLSQTLSDQGQFNDAIKVLKRFQQEAPYDPETPNTQKEIVSLNFELSRLTVVWTELARMPKMFGPGSAWANKNKGNKEPYLAAQQMIKDQIMYYAKLTHKNAQKDDNKATYTQALKGYQLYLTSYPKSKEVAEVKWLMADIHYFNKNFREAGKLYLEIALLGKEKAQIFDPKSGKGKPIHKDASRYMLDSYATNFDPELKALIKKKPDFAKGAMPLSENAKNFIKACGFYAKWYPDEKKDVKTCDLGITEVYYRLQDKKMAMKYLWLLAKKYPGTKEGDTAVDQLIPLYGTDKKALAKAVAELRKIPAYQKGEIGKKLADLEFGTKVDVLVAEKDACKRAAGYEDLYKKNPKAGGEALKLINNAGVDYIKCGKIADGIRAYQVVLSAFPASEPAKDAMLEVAKLNENRLDLEAAAKYFADYAKKYPKEKAAVGSLAHACELQAATQSSNAINTCLAFSAADAGGAKIIFSRMMRTAFSAGDEGKLASLARLYESKFKLSADERINAYAMLYQKGNGAAAGQILETFKQSGGNVQGEALRAVGGLVFKQVAGEIKKFEAVHLRGGTVDALGASIQQKVGMLGKVSGAYEQVLATKDAYWGVAALYNMGYAREILYNDLSNPPEIKGAKKEDVVKQLAGDANAAKAEAVKFYGQALQAVEKFLVYNEWAAKALSGMARISGKNINFDDLIVRADFLGGEVPENIAAAVKGGGGGEGE